MTIKSWWQFGEGAGYSGGGLALHKIPCAFCDQTGNWSRVGHFDKKSANGRKVLNFETYQCGNCASYIQVFWSANEHNDVHDFRVVPWALGKLKAPEHWPAEVQRFWLQAHGSVASEHWDAAALMTRSSLQIALRDHKASGKNLKAEIDDLAAKGILPPIMKEWSNELRELGNDSAHPTPGATSPTPADVQNVLAFLDYLLQYLYDLPKQIADYRNRKMNPK